METRRTAGFSQSWEPFSSEIGVNVLPVFVVKGAADAADPVICVRLVLLLFPHFIRQTDEPPVGDRRSLQNTQVAKEHKGGLSRWAEPGWEEDRGRRVSGDKDNNI